MRTVPKVSLLRLQPTTGCNLDCAYCYIPSRARARSVAMSPSVLAATLDRLVEEDLLDDELTISWHGAEPLMAGIGWYREAVAMIDDTLDGVRCHHVFQTNGTLIDDDWCQLFREIDAAVGVSLDGIGAQSSQRVNWAGRPAEQAVRRGMARLDRHGLEWTLLAVVTAATMSDPAAFVRMVRESGCRYLGYKVEETHVAHTSGLGSDAEVDEVYAAFVRHLWRELAADDRVTVREFERYRQARHHPRRRAIPVTLIPLRNLTVAANGDFTVFSAELLLSGDPRFVFGNVLDGPLLDSLTSRQFVEVADEIRSGVRACASSCSFYRHCGSFYLSQKLAETGTFDVAETMACRLEVKTAFTAIDSLRATDLGDTGAR